MRYQVAGSKYREIAVTATHEAVFLNMQEWVMLLLQKLHLNFGKYLAGKCLLLLSCIDLIN